MSAPAFTPGPWGKNCSHIYAPDGAIIATVSNPGSKPSDYPLVANRDLMAAAPDYDAFTVEALPQLEVLHSALPAGQARVAVWRVILNGRAALAKARGDA